MRNSLILILIFAITLTVGCSNSKEEDTIEETGDASINENNYFTFNKETGEITGYDIKNGYEVNEGYRHITIPIEINGVTVTKIGKDVFKNHYLTSVTLSEGVTVISDGAFDGGKIKSIKLPSTLVSIGKNAFANNELMSLTIPDSVAYIGEGAFSNNALETVSLPKGLSSIEDDTFSYNNLTDVFIDENIKSIGINAFTPNNIKEVMIPIETKIIEEDKKSSFDSSVKVKRQHKDFKNEKIEGIEEGEI